MMKSKTCAYCGKKFVSSTKAKTCSGSCFIGLKREYTRKRREKNTPILNRTCSVCGKEFTTKRKQQVYCSQECRLVNNKLTRTKKVV